MKTLKKIMKSGLLKYGTAIASFAFAAVVIAGNSSCYLPYYEPEEPKGLEKFKKFDK